METVPTYALKPIGHMKSLFHFKNGTPRQSSLCENARGILTIEKSVFNNPEHSLDGLQDYSHAWILFIFHKNNNSHKKAKVKPPRLDGQRVGVFSTRSPYRPNNIGLSLVKIDKIQGATIHFSGIDILDGTPIIDIKPYIPSYDKPTSHEPSLLLTNNSAEESKSISETITSSDETPIKSHHQTKSKSTVYSLPLPSTSAENMKADECTSVEEGFYSLSTALDKARETIQQGIKDKDVSCSDHENNGQQNVTDASVSVSDVLGSVDLGNICGSEDRSKDGGNSAHIEGNNNNSDADDALLNFLVGNVISKAASDIFLSDDLTIEKDPDAGAIRDSINSSGDSSSINSTKLSSNKNTKKMCKNSGVKQSDHSRETTGARNCNNKDILAVTAPWLSSPPVAKVNVVFSAESLDQLQSFHSGATDPRYRTELLSGPDDAKKAIRSILHEEPRSVYRRQKCQNSEYFFAIDVLHVTCWFDGDTVTVVRIRPAADVPQLQGKH